MDKKYLYVVLTRSNTLLSNLIHMIKEDEYTHASLSLDKNLQYMFSFGRRYTNNPFIGCFKQEYLDKGLYAKHKELPGLILQLPVSTQEYEQVKSMVEEFVLNEYDYGYNYLGLVNSLFGISSYNNNRFLCSEFVYFVLNKCGICDLKLPRNLVRPQDLSNISAEVLYKGDLKQYV